MRTLIIVESAKKAKTIKGMLGRDYTVKATSGHILEMPRDDIHVDLETFQPRLQLIRGKGKVLQQLKKAAENADAILLATDPDREGEAIAAHVLQRLGQASARKAQRVAFTAITEADIRRAISKPRDVDHALVDAQTARRVIDRLVGYMVSPVLWAGFSGVKGLSAGRVQSPALWLVVDRERAIRDFKAEEWWSVDAEVSPSGQTPAQRFWARLHHIDGQKPALKRAEQAETVRAALENAAWTVDKVARSTRRRNPYPPFTTDSLQQAASSQLGFGPKRTMQLAQQLYEGVNVGEGKAVGLITYMRTDSVQVAPEAAQAAREVIQHYWGKDYLPARPPTYRTKDKTAQEAHEAIRPTEVWRTPKKIEAHLEPDAYKLYRLIWRRFVAAQMKPAVYNVLTVDIIPQPANRHYLFRATGRTLAFAGFLKAYGVDADAEQARRPQKGANDEALPENDQLPNLQAGQALTLHQLLPKQHFTKPPNRYTEAGLIGALKKEGLGRPSTYATIIDTLKKRNYVIRQGKHLQPTELGFAVCELLESCLPDVVAVGFTAQMETDLDRIAQGEITRLATLRAFYQPFAQTVAAAKQQARTQRKSIASQKPTRQRRSKTGSRGKRSKPKTTAPTSGEKVVAQTCPQCKTGTLVAKKGKYGSFLGCSRFKEGCRYTQKIKP